MKPQLIRGEHLTRQQKQDVIRWLRANGCRHLVPFDARIKVTGNYVTLETFTFRSYRQAWTLLPRKFPEDYDMPTKTRKYRIRHELRWTK